MEKAIKLPCSPANTPVYKTNENILVSYSPARRVVVPKDTKQNETNDHSPGGLYPSELISEWLSYAFLQHLSIHSYALFSQSICQSPDCKEVHSSPSTMISYIGGAIQDLGALAKDALWFGINLEKLGGKCSIFICLALAVYSLYSIVIWFIRFSLFRQENIKCCALFCRATWPSLFLITKSNTDPNVNDA